MINYLAKIEYVISCEVTFGFAKALTKRISITHKHEITKEHARDSN